MHVGIERGGRGGRGPCVSVWTECTLGALPGSQRPPSLAYGRMNVISSLGRWGKTASVEPQCEFLEEGMVAKAS